MSDTFTTSISSFPDNFTVSISAIQDVFNVAIQEAHDGITPLLSATSDALEVSTDNGSTWQELVNYQDIVDSVSLSASDIYGGTMNGNLTIVGAISASQYLGIPYPSENDDLDTVTSRGNITTNSVSVGGLSATTINVSGGTITGTNLNTEKANLSGGNAFTGNQTFSTNTLFVDSLSGRVGIGTIAPEAQLQISALSAATKGLVLRGFASQSANLQEWQSSTGTGLSYVDSVGNIKVTGNNIATLGYSFTGDTNTGMYSAGPDILGLATGGIQRIAILANGNVGVGAASPSAKLSIGSGSLVDSNIPVQISTAGNGTEANYGVNKNGAYGFLLGYKNLGSIGSISSQSGGYMRQITTDPFFIVVNNTRISTAWLDDGTIGFGGNINNATTLSGANMYLSSTGSVGIGTVEPSEKLHVVGNALVTGNLSATGGATVGGTLVATGKVTANGQGALSALGDNDVLTKGSGDDLYGVLKHSTLSSSVSAYSTTSIDTPLSLILEPGTWHLDMFCELSTASATGGAQVELATVNSGDSCHGSCFETRAINGTVNAQRWLTNTGALRTIYTVLTDAPGTVAYGSGQSVIYVSNLATYTMKLRQRTVTDATNPAILKARSWIVARKLD